MMRPKVWSIEGFLVQRHADPQTTPPRIWLRAVLGLRMRPAAIALTTRVTRITPSSSSTFTSANTAEWVLLACAHHWRIVVDRLLLDAITPPCRMASAIDTARPASRVSTILPSRKHDVAGLRVRRAANWASSWRGCNSRRAPRPAVLTMACDDRGRGPRAALHRRLRQRRIAEPTADGVERQAEQHPPRPAP